MAFAATFYSGVWQQGRATEKRALQAEFAQRIVAPAIALSSSTRDATGMRYRQVVASGEWMPDGQIFLDNKTDGNGGRAGYHVITPLKLAAAGPASAASATKTDAAVYVLVNRGWVARSARYPLPPAIDAPSGEVIVRGVSVVPTTRFLELSSAAVEGNVWQNLTIERYRSATKRDVLPVVVLAAETSPNAMQGLQAITEKPDARVEKHIEYMLTWYSLAATVVALWIGLNLKFSTPASTTAAENSSHQS